MTDQSAVEADGKSPDTGPRRAGGSQAGAVQTGSRHPASPTKLAGTRGSKGQDQTEDWLCLSGGNALGAFHVGAWKAVQEAGLNVTRIAGASIGAVVAAVIGGNRVRHRLAALNALLDDIAQSPDLFGGRRSLVLKTMMVGHPAMFSPAVPGLISTLPALTPDTAAFQRRPMRRLLERYVDFDVLNKSRIEVTVTALDAETGLVTDFRNTTTGITVDHLLASTALPIMFRPVLLAGRYYFDAGLTENLPVRALLDRAGGGRILAFDLFRPTGPLQPTMDGIADRAQDLAFGCQSRNVIAACDLRGHRFCHVILSDPDDVFSGKALDFSRNSLDRRQAMGHHLTVEALNAADAISMTEVER